MDGFRVRAVQFPVQLPTLVRQCETVRPYPSQGVSPRVRVSQAPPDLTTRTPSRALVAVTEMTPTEIRSITERIEARLESIAEHESAIRSDLQALAALTSPPGDDHLLDVEEAADWLGVSRATMYRLLRTDPRLRCVKIGTRTRFRPDDLRCYTAGEAAS
jgi:excisionase family DNA binding protein